VTITLEDIREAAALIAPAIEQTPCAHSLTLSQITGAAVFLKFENLQFTGAFKERGALRKLLSLTPAERKAGVVAMSAGNHAQAVAYHAQRLGIPALIVMPRFTPNVKVEHTGAFGAEIILHGADLEEASCFTLELARERGLTLIHPYDDEKIIAGQGTIALEMLEVYPDLEVLFVPVGGGGLIAGIAVAAKSLRPSIEIIGI
jgi:threonine dehydratase